MKIEKLVEQIRLKKSFLCVGLDPDLDKMPTHLANSNEGVFEFNKAIIDATASYAVAYKPNIAFYEALGLAGWQALEKTIQYLNNNYPEIYTIADAKRGDIGNTSTKYAQAFFEKMKFDSITIAPYMGKDSVEPFLAFEEKQSILLALTSNEGASDFQLINNKNESLFEKVIRISQKWTNAHNLMYVVGATKSAHFQQIRKIAPDNFLLVPGVGAQGGSLDEVCKFGLNDQVGLLVNSSRGIIYASNASDFADAAKTQAQKLQQQMAVYL
ncbi:MAG: orotidine-5'-phosphate decarboxylase [Bacteroidota bacterium]